MESASLRATVLSLLLAPIAAQVPPNGVVCVGHGSQGPIVGALANGAITPFVGLPQTLQLSAQYPGARCVLALPDGDVLVGAGISRWNGFGPLSIERLTLVGQQVVSSRSYTIGQHQAASVVGLTLLPGDRVAFVVDSPWVSSGAPALGVLDLATGAVTGLTAPSTRLWGVAYHPQRNSLFVSNAFSGLFEILPAPTAILTLVAGAAPGALAVTPAGDVLIANDGVTRWDPQTRTLTPVAGIPSTLGGLAVDAVSGDRVYSWNRTPLRFPLMANAHTPVVSAVERDAAGLRTQLAAAQGTYFGSLSVRPSVWAFGSGTPRASTYTWAIPGNAGGLPTRGNAGFSLTVRATPGVPAAAVVLLGSARSSLVLAGVEVLVALPGAQALPVTPASTMTLPLPIPSSAALVGLEFHAQALGLEGSGATWGSDGVTIAVLP